MPAPERFHANTATASCTSFWNLLRKHNLHPYHVCLHQDLTEADFKKRIELYSWALIKVNEYKGFLNKQIWSHGAYFYSDRAVNFHNAHHRSNHNPNWLRENNNELFSVYHSLMRHPRQHDYWTLLSGRQSHRQNVHSGSHS